MVWNAIFVFWFKYIKLLNKSMGLYILYNNVYSIFLKRDR